MSRSNRGLLAYLTIVLLLASGRIAALVYVYHSMVTHTVTDLGDKLSWSLYPEILFIGKLPFSIVGAK